jgi:beta-N-acetylhexosaminidase
MATLRQKIGQMFMVGVQRESLSGEEQLIMKRYPFGGFILFSRNCRELAQTLSLCQTLWATGTEIRPFIAIDQEGGRVHRLPKPFTHFPASGILGQRGDPELAYTVGRATAAELALVGINLNFAPVLDVNSNPTNPIIGDRSFGCTPAVVIQLSEKWIEGLKDGGLIPCGKHFPGHGDTDKDSHLDLPAVERPLEELKSVELPPFVRACRNDIESVMTAHVRYRALDPEFPATLSQRIVNGLLRQQLGYEGVVFSDDMEMKAISKNYGDEEAVALCVRAGIDVILCCHDLAKAMGAFEFLYAEAERDPAVRAQVEMSFRRITRLKQRYLNRFTGAGKRELRERLTQLDHQRIVDEIHGSL